MTTALVFRDHQFSVITRDNKIWLSSADVASALNYADDKSIHRIYSRHADEFTTGMVGVVKLTTPGGVQEVRIFSLRGAHLIAMFARTPVAKEFRRWVLDVLDREVEKAHQITSDQSANHSPSVNFPVSNTDNEYRYLVQMFIYDTVFGGCVELKGRGNTFKSIANGIASDLGYRPTGFVERAINRELLSRI